MGRIKYGISKCYYAKATDDGNGTLTYATPVALLGARSLSLEQNGESSDEYFDNILWYHSDSNNGYTGTLELAYLPDSFYTDILGMTTDTNGLLWEKNDAAQVEFALMFQFNVAGSSTITASRHCMLRCVASRPALTGNTKEGTIAADTETINITAMPRVDGYVKYSCDSTDTGYTNFFSSVATHA